MSLRGQRKPSAHSSRSRLKAGAYAAGTPVAPWPSKEFRMRARYRCDYRSRVPIQGTNWTLRAGHAVDISLVFDNSEIRDLQGDGPGLKEFQVR
jgi:hypothetical protein